MSIRQCEICGELKHITMKCTRCGRIVCLNDVFVKNGMCSDCLAIEINAQYKEVEVISCETKI